MLLALAASAADVSGAWRGTFTIALPDGKTRDDTVHLVLKQNGGTITGTAGPNRRTTGADREGDDRRATGSHSKCRFPMACSEFDVMLDGDHLKGDVTRTAGGESMKARWTPRASDRRRAAVGN